MKKSFLLSCLLLLVSAGARAEEFSITDFTITPGGETDVELCLTCEADAWGGFQFDLVLPEGLSVVEDEYGMWYEVTDRLTYKGRKTEEFDVMGGLQENGRYRIIVGNPAQKSLQGTEGAVMTLRLRADDTMATGQYPIGFEEIVFSDPLGSGGIEPAPIENGGIAEVVMNVVVSEVGFATLSWPRALDFSDTNLEVYIGTKINGDALQLKRINKVPAHTGVILVGNAGTYHPVTTESGDDASGNLLLPTDDGAVDVNGEGYYALASYDEVAFYPVKEGLNVPQYRAYLKIDGQTSDAPRFISFSTLVTGVAPFSLSPEKECWYRIDGTKATSTNRSGIYVKQGKKIKL